MNKTEYNGWTNFETWNVAVWIGSDEGLEELARESGDYKTFRETMREDFETTETPDKVAYNDSGLNITELDNMITELNGEES